MIAALWLMAAQGMLGAFDTAYYHEYRARLPAGGSRTRTELWLHAVRDFIYACFFCTLPFITWSGRFAIALFTLVAAEIVITMADFAVEVKAREPIGVLPGERVTHGLMAIVYGAMLANLAPRAWVWMDGPTAWQHVVYDVPVALTFALVAMGVGVFGSGLRDAYAALDLPNGRYPW